MKDFYLTQFYIQPTEFNALDHKRTFKIVLAGLFVFIILYVGAMFWFVWYFDETETLFKTGWMKLTDDVVMSKEADMTTLFTIFS